MKKIHNDVITSVFLILVSVFFIGASKTYTEAEAGMFPTIFAVLLILVSVLILIGGIKKSKLMNDASVPEANKPNNEIPAQEMKNAVLMFGILLIYAIAILYLGFFVSTLIFMAGTMWLLKIRNPLILALVPLGLDLVIYFVMVQNLNVRLPHGFLF